MKGSLIGIFLLLTGVVFGQAISAIDSMMQQALGSNKVPALAVAVIDSGKLVHLNTTGFKDLDQKTVANINTSFHIASVSKVVTNLAIFKLVEQGKLDVDQDVNRYLPFVIKNPHHPDDRISVKELLNHRSGIKDDSEIYGPLWSEPKGDPKVSLLDFLGDYLTTKGKMYKKEHYESGAARESFSYSNTAVALLGLVVETVSGMSYEEFCQRHIFKPLQMKNTSWFLKYLDQEEVAKTYVYSDSLGLQFKGHNGYPDYPAGQLRTSISDFSKLLLGYLNASDSTFMLAGETTNFITPEPVYAQMGYFTWFLTTMGNRFYYSHQGGDTGVRTVAAIDVKNKNGIAIFANAEFKLGDLLRAIEDEMWGK